MGMWQACVHTYAFAGFSFLEGTPLAPCAAIYNSGFGSDARGGHLQLFNFLIFIKNVNLKVVKAS